MNHKRGRPKARRAACLLCKPGKFGHGVERRPQHTGFGKLRLCATAVTLSEYE